MSVDATDRPSPWQDALRRLVRGVAGTVLLWLALAIHHLVQAAAAGRARTVAAPPAGWFHEWAIVLYLGLFPVLVLTFVASEWRAWWRFVAGCGLACALGWLLMLAAPMTFPRPAPRGDGPAAVLVAMIQHYDPAHVTFPSLHVAVTWLAVDVQVGRHRRIAIALAAAAISVSTMMVAQHAPLDVAAGLALAFIAAWATRSMAGGEQRRG